MKKIFLLLFLTIHNLAFAGLWKESYCETQKQSASTASIFRDYTIFEKDGKIVISFSFDIETSGDYFVSMWHCPISDFNSFLPYTVHLNNVQLPTYICEKSGWQGGLLNNEKSVYLNSGKNTLTISLKNNIIPSVECVCLSKDKESVIFDDTNYNKYIEDANNGIVNCSSNDLSEFIQQEDNLDALIIRNGLDLKYSFYTTMSLKKDDIVTLKSTSTIDHDIDLFLVGYSSVTNGIKNNVENQTTSLNDRKLYFLSPSIEETEKINWHAPSYYTPENYCNAFLEAKIPKDGIYMIRVKPQSSDMIGTANLVINNNLQYENVPIFVRRIGINTYEANVKYNFSTDNCLNGDPMLFIESLRGSRIVAYNDDGGTNKNALVSGKFSFAPYAFQVNNYSSLTPESTCSVIVIQVPVSETEIISYNYGDEKNNQKLNKMSLSLHNYSITLDNKTGENLLILTDECITEIQCIGIDGSLKYSNNITTANPISIPLHEFNLYEPGIYIFRVKIGEEWISKKILIK